MDVPSLVVSAFTRDGEGGNLAGVVLQADALDERQMQAIASRLGLSETAFVSSSGLGDVQLRFFTPTAEVPICGHATIAAWHALLECGRFSPGSYWMETGAGLQNIDCSASGVVTMSQNLPSFGPVVAPEPVLQALGLPSAALLAADKMPVQVASTGLHKIFAPITSWEYLASIRPDLAAIEAISRAYGAIGIYCFTLDSPGAATARCRNFAPVVGIREDSATGTSAAATSCLLVHHGLIAASSRVELSFEQGDAIDQPSEIAVALELEGDDFVGVYVSGKARSLEHRTLNC
ncbi:MAG: phenazine biosynthesis protein PhzF [Rickettsiales bacterium]|nr:phenazine biosynthesis protein PhzF [Rickettsiales bacterium]|tara:strand:+ start:923 stop:1798 length:876 start_codon:yes stop_codon:yes gene_type:complete